MRIRPKVCALDPAGVRYGLRYPKNRAWRLRAPLQTEGLCVYHRKIHHEVEKVKEVEEGEKVPGTVFPK
jgi:hypothetical protein